MHGQNHIKLIKFKFIIELKIVTKKISRKGKE
jgi:hypothetical protein